MVLEKQLTAVQHFQKINTLLLGESFMSLEGKRNVICHLGGDLTEDSIIKHKVDGRVLSNEQVLSSLFQASSASTPCCMPIPE